MAPSARIRSGFTLIELLVVIAIIAVLIGLLLPAVQRVREAAANSSCRNNLKQLALAAHQYHSSFDAFPAGVALPGPDSMYTSLFVELLPSLEQSGLANRWDYSNPANNFGAAGTPAATPLQVFVCPSAGVTQNPAAFGSLSVGVTTYGANGGSQSFPETRATHDGLFDYASATSWNRVRLSDVTDGTSSTLLFGERTIADGNLDTYQSAKFKSPPSPPLQATTSFSSWAVQSGPNAGAGLLLAGTSAVNANFPTRWEPPPPPAPPPSPIDWNKFGPSVWDRLSAYGSKHTRGTNFALADGSVRFMTNGIAAGIVLQASTRAGGEVFSLD